MNRCILQCLGSTFPEMLFFTSTDTPESSDSGLVVPQDTIKQEPSPSPPPASTEEPQSQILSSLRLENQLLRSEVASLNGEMASVIQRAKDLQDGKTLDSNNCVFLSIIFLPVQINHFLSFRIEPDTFACR